MYSFKVCVFRPLRCDCTTLKRVAERYAGLRDSGRIIIVVRRAVDRGNDVLLGPGQQNAGEIELFLNLKKKARIGITYQSSPGP